MLECQQIMMLPHTIHHQQMMGPHYNLSHNNTHNNQQQQQQQHHHHNSQSQQNSPISNTNQYQHSQQQQQQQQMISANQFANNQQQQIHQPLSESPIYSQVAAIEAAAAAVAAAPPTPPSEDGHYLSPPNGNGTGNGGDGSGRPVGQTIVRPASNWMVQQHESIPSNQTNINYNTQNHHHHHQAANQVSSSNNTSQQTTTTATTIASYYYDIDDEFSDILSAPPTPEPHQVNYVHHHNTTTCETQSAPCDNYHNYMPFNPLNSSQQQHHHQHPNHHHDHQHQHQQGPMAYEMGSHYVMSPDSSSLSTTSSSPSDHSLYQSSIHSSSSSSGHHQHHHSQQKQQVNLHLHHQQLQHPDLSPVSLSDNSCGLNMANQQQQQLSQTQIQPSNHLSTNRSPPVNQRMGNHQQQQQLSTGQLAGQLATQQQLQRPNPNPNPNPQPNHPHHHHRSSPIHLWEFLKELLQQVDTGCADSTVIRWLDKQKGVFKIEDSVRVAKLWGKRKNKPKMNYDKLSRSIRQYYKKGIMKKTDRSQRLVYQFCSAYCH